MKTIYKYTLAINGDDLIQLPKHSTILSLQVQNNKPCIWVLIDPNEAMEDIHFVTYGTGHEIRPGLGDFVGTYQLNDGEFVFHVFKQN
jgi:hypothetical protein